MKKIPEGTRLVIGKNSVLEVIRWSANKLHSLVAVKDPSEILDSNEVKGCRWEKVNFEALSKLSNSENHQGIGAIVRQEPKVDLKGRAKELAEMPSSCVVLLTAVQDPHHLGAVFRAAEAFGIDLLVWPNSNSVGLNPIVSKVAVGASELVPFCEVSNINEAIRKLKKEGFWIVAAEPSTGSQALSKFEFPNHFALVLGAEGQGIPKLTLELSDFKVAIDQSGKIDSVSLSQAAAVFLYENRRQILIKGI